MIANLHIKNIGIIEDLNIDLNKGLNVLTGETGAGKTLIIDSLQIISGGRFSKEMIRRGENNSFVELCMYLPNSEKAEDGNIIVSREINTNGKNMCKINGRMVTVNELKEFMSEFIDIHGQNDNQHLLDNKKQLGYLDGYAGDEIKELKQKYYETYIQYGKIKKELKDNFGDDKEKQRKIDLLQYQIKEIEEADLKIGEEATLEENVEKEVEKLKTSVEVIEYLKTVYANEYNEEYNTNVNKENVEITKNREGISLVEDKDENGNDIIRNINKNDPEDIKTVDIESGVVTAKVYDENKNMLSIQQVLNDGKNNYKGIEDSENNVLIKVGKILDKGIDWSTSIDQKDTNEKIKQNYKKQFIDSIVEFKENQIEEIKTESLGEER